MNPEAGLEVPADHESETGVNFATNNRQSPRPAGAAHPGRPENQSSAQVGRSAGRPGPSRAAPGPTQGAPRAAEPELREGRPDASQGSSNNCNKTPADASFKLPDRLPSANQLNEPLIKRSSDASPAQLASAQVQHWPAPPAAASKSPVVVARCEPPAAAETNPLASTCSQAHPRPLTSGDGRPAQVVAPASDRPPRSWSLVAPLAAAAQQAPGQPIDLWQMCKHPADYYNQTNTAAAAAAICANPAQPQRRDSHTPPANHSNSSNNNNNNNISTSSNYLVANRPSGSNISSCRQVAANEPRQPRQTCRLDQPTNQPAALAGLSSESPAPRCSIETTPNEAATNDGRSIADSTLNENDNLHNSCQNPPACACSSKQLHATNLNFLRFLSNLSKSITQQHKQHHQQLDKRLLGHLDAATEAEAGATAPVRHPEQLLSSCNLAPEVVGYYVKQQHSGCAARLCANSAASRAANMTQVPARPSAGAPPNSSDQAGGQHHQHPAHSASGASAKSGRTDQQQQQHQELNQRPPPMATTISGADQPTPADQDSASAPRSQAKQQLAPNPQDQPGARMKSCAHKEDATCPARGQAELGPNASETSTTACGHKQELQHQANLSKQQARLLSIGTTTNTSATTNTTTTTRSSVSSLSSCILSDASSVSEARLKWGKKMDFLLSIIGFAVDMANMWRFPYLVYKNGGGVFLIAYVTMLIFGGIPLFFLELCLGQFVKKGPITVWNKICPPMKGVGYCSILISWYVSFYYNVLIAWSVYFIYRSLSSFGDKMPWEECDNSWNSKNGSCVSISSLKLSCSTQNDTLEVCRKKLFATNVTSPASEFFVKELSQIDQSSGLDDMGALRPELVACLLVVYLLHYFSLFRGLETSGKVVWVTATAPYMILSVLLARGLFLPGAYLGIKYYLSPDLGKLSEPQVWIDAAGQVFYSIGVGFGVHLTYASFNSHNNNCFRDCIMTSAINALTSVYSGLVVFVYLGYMATNLGIDIDKVASEGYSLVFEVYPEALTTLPIARFWTILFFIMMLTLGIDSAMGGLEAIITGLEDEFKLAKRLSRSQLTGLVISSSFLFALISCTQGGAYTLFWFDIYAAGISLLFSALAETIGVVYFYGLDKFLVNIESMLGKKPQLFFIICWKYISPISLTIVIFMSIYAHTPPTYRNYTFPDWSVVLGFCVAFSSISAIPIVALWTWWSGDCYRDSKNKRSSSSPRKRGIDSVESGRHGAGSSGATRKSPHHYKSTTVSCNNRDQFGLTAGSITTTTVVDTSPSADHPYRSSTSALHAPMGEEML